MVCIKGKVYDRGGTGLPVVVVVVFVTFLWWPRLVAGCGPRPIRVLIIRILIIKILIIRVLNNKDLYNKDPYYKGLYIH